MTHAQNAYDSMRHQENVKLGKSPINPTDFISVETVEIDGIEKRIVSFELQPAPIGEVGVIGCQLTDMVEFCRHMLESLNESFPCSHNENSLRCLKGFAEYQAKRTSDREKRGVEGKSQA